MSREVEMLFRLIKRQLYYVRYASLNADPEHCGKRRTTDLKITIYGKMAKEEHSLDGQALGTRPESKIIPAIWVKEKGDGELTQNDGVMGS